MKMGGVGSEGWEEAMAGSEPARLEFRCSIFTNPSVAPAGRTICCGIEGVWGIRIRTEFVRDRANTVPGRTIPTHRIRIQEEKARVSFNAEPNR